MRITLDTNCYVDFAKGDKAAVEAFRRAQEIFVPLIVLAELRAGFLHGTRGPENERSLVKFLNSPRVSVLYPDEDTTHHYARIFLQLRRQGTPIPTNDLWIAALVIQHKLILCARDRHFDHLPQIPMFNM
jgi:tRNA(fMet)-specific endonuclease VapC